MNRESKCVSLELAQQLDKRGVRVDSEFVWFTDKKTGETFLDTHGDWSQALDSGLPTADYIYSSVPALLPCELLEVLPDYIRHKKYGYGSLMILKLGNESDSDFCYHIKYFNNEKFSANGKLLANALSTLAIKLIGEGLLEVGKCE